MKDFIIDAIATLLSFVVLTVIMALPIGIALLLWLPGMAFVQFLVMTLKLGLSVMCILLVISVAIGFLKD